MPLVIALVVGLLALSACGSGSHSPASGSGSGSPPASGSGSTSSTTGTAASSPEQQDLLIAQLRLQIANLMKQLHEAQSDSSICSAALSGIRSTLTAQQERNDQAAIAAAEEAQKAAQATINRGSAKP